MELERRLRDLLGDDVTELDRMYREARYARLYDGPDEVHRMVVARQLLSSDPSAWPWA